MDDYNTNIIKDMRPMERHRFMVSNTNVCPHCNKTKKLNLFWVKEDNIIMNVCKSCDKKIKNMEAIKIALSSVNLNNN